DLASAFLSGPNTQYTLFTAKTPDSVAAGEPFLSFSTLSYRRSSPESASLSASPRQSRPPRPGALPPRSDAVRVEYLLQPPQSGADTGGTLLRRERWLTETGPGETDIVCGRVAQIRLRFSGSGEEAQDGWSAE